MTVHYYYNPINSFCVRANLEVFRRHSLCSIRLYYEKLAVANISDGFKARAMKPPPKIKSHLGLHDCAFLLKSNQWFLCESEFRGF